MTADVGAPSSPILESVFGQQLPAVRRYAALLATQAVDRGLLGPREASRIWDRHVLNCAVIAPAFPAAASVCDVGSGAGLPGIVLALVRPDLRVTLVEPLLRRAAFLTEVLDDLGIAATVVRARAETLHGGGTYDVVTARAVAPLDRLAKWCLPLCRAGGELVAIKGSGARAELAAAEPELRRLGAEELRIEKFGQGVVKPVTTVIRIRSRAQRT